MHKADNSHKKKVFVRRKAKVEARQIVFIKELSEVKSTISRGESAEALRLLDRIAGIYSRDSFILPTHYYGMKAQALAFEGRLAEAITVCCEAIKEGQANTFIYNQLANIELQTNNFSSIVRAVELLERMFEAELPAASPDFFSYLILARGYIAIGKYDMAQDVLLKIDKKVIEEIPSPEGRKKTNAFKEFLYRMAGNRDVRRDHLSGITIDEYNEFAKEARYPRNHFWDNAINFSKRGIYLVNIQRRF